MTTCSLSVLIKNNFLTGFMLFCLMQSICYFSRFMTSLFKYKIDQRLMNDVHKSNSVADFWKRWNFPIRDIIKRYSYVPLRKFGCNRYLTVFLTFFTTGILHGISEFIAGLSLFSSFLICLPFLL
jgi:D-alanyl-lipoteichoic acid acyltransferase DltB (MBOAT superfamily)